MKKNDLFSSYRKKIRGLIMSKWFVLFFFMVVIPGRVLSYSQQKVNLDIKNGRLTDLFQSIQKQTPYRFFFSDEDVNPVSGIDVHATDEEIESVLKKALKNTNLTYQIQNEIIFIKKAVPQADQESVTITGVVMDESRSPIPGAAVYLKGTQVGTVSDVNGSFRMTLPKSNNIVLVFSFVGFEPQEVTYKNDDKPLHIILKEEISEIEEVVVNGIFTRKAESFTGSAKTYKKDDLKRVGNTNVFQSLKNLDPSLRIMDNLTMGSNPNSLPEMRLRGTTSFPGESSNTSLKGNYQANTNQPLFILDGFEVSIEQVFDLDMNRIENITILKDAASKAIYGSKAANGVIVIETIGLGGKEIRVSYSGSLDLEIPDLSSYNLCNAEEKLQVEVLAGNIYPDTYQAMTLYNDRLKRVHEGLNEYWISKPLQTGVGQKHAMSLEFGEKQVRSTFDASYSEVIGVMKESFRKNFSGSMNLTYRRSNILFRNLMSVTSNKSQNSPYGDFSEYTRVNPYSPAYDENGNLNQMYERGIYTVDYSPLYDALTNSRDRTSYLTFTDNLHLEWEVTNGLRLLGRVGFIAKRSDADEYYPSEHSGSGYNYNRDEYYKRGKYTVNSGKSNTYSTELYLTFTKTFDKHTFFTTGGWELSEEKYMEIVNTSQGYMYDYLNEYLFGSMYEENSSPDGGSGKKRNVGVLGVAGYSYDDRYLLDATLRGSGASAFGSNNRWATFWSIGLGWNIHNEKYVRDNFRFIDLFKVRGSMGYTGNENFSSNTALATYVFYTDQLYNRFWVGSTLKNMKNPDLKWELKKDYNIGVDFKMKNLSVTFDWYLANTENLVTSITIPASTGFTRVSENLGLVQNKGIELYVGYNILNNKDYFLNFTGSIATNSNKLKKLSDAMKDYNDQQLELAAEGTKPVIMYYEGMHINTIWAVPSLGIDPADGYEMFVNQEGLLTKTWNANDMIPAGVDDPKYNGNFGINGEYKGIGLSVVFTYHGGREKYNQTLVDKVENASAYYNVDKRYLYDRWKQPGDQTKYKRIQQDKNHPVLNVETGGNVTRSTTRFVQKDNELNISSLSLYYDVNPQWVSKFGFERLKIQAYMNDVHKWSTIKLERGTSYPFSWKFNLSLTATF